METVDHAYLKKQLAFRIALSNSMSPQDALPGGPNCTDYGIEIAKDDELIAERDLILIRILQGWGIDTYECGAVVQWFLVRGSLTDIKRSLIRVWALDSS